MSLELFFIITITSAVAVTAIGGYMYERFISKWR